MKEVEERFSLLTKKYNPTFKQRAIQKDPLETKIVTLKDQIDGKLAYSPERLNNNFSDLMPYRLEACEYLRSIEQKTVYIDFDKVMISNWNSFNPKDFEVQQEPQVQTPKTMITLEQPSDKI